MNFYKLDKIDKPCFGIEDIARVLGISNDSAKVAGNRYVKQGLLIRLKRNVYLTRENWRTLTREQQFSLANNLQSPSYISLMTALDYFGITTQIQRDFIESVAVQRSAERVISQTVFNYSKIKRNLYFGFVRYNDFFIATPEKAFIDAVYLSSLGRYSLDIASLDLHTLNIEKIKQMADNFPEKTKMRLLEYDYA